MSYLLKIPFINSSNTPTLPPIPSRTRWTWPSNAHTKPSRRVESRRACQNMSDVNITNDAISTWRHGIIESDYEYKKSSDRLSHPTCACRSKRHAILSRRRIIAIDADTKLISKLVCRRPERWMAQPSLLMI